MTVIQASKIANLVIDYLKEGNNLGILPEVISLLKKKSVGLGQQGSAVITSAAKLDSADLASLTAFITDKYGSDYNIVEKIDPNLIAGFTIKVGDEVIDSSLVAKLENIRKELI